MVPTKETTGKNEITTAGVWKIALFLLSYLIMGVWIAAQISAGNETMREDIREMKRDIRYLTKRLDDHIDQKAELKGLTYGNRQESNPNDYNGRGGTH